MRIDNQRRSDNFEDRGGRRGGGGGAGIPMRLGNLSFGTIVIIGLVLLGIYFFAPPGIRDAVFSQITGGQMGAGAGSTTERVCDAKPTECDFSRAILGATEDVWNAQFAQARLPSYPGATAAGGYQAPTLVVFEGEVNTECGTAPSSVGPFYCPLDRNLYIDPSFYDVLAQRLNAPGDFAQGYVIAHEVGHHVQNLIGSINAGVAGDDPNENSVRRELQADCFAGVWGHNKREDLDISDADLDEALGAAHAIGDDTLQRQGRGYVNPNEFSHGTSEQRMRWFRTGFDNGDPRRCDTFAADYSRL